LNAPGPSALPGLSLPQAASSAADVATPKNNPRDTGFTLSNAPDRGKDHEKRCDPARLEATQQRRASGQHPVPGRNAQRWATTVCSMQPPRSGK
jgi:hypothetical protein